MSGTMTGTGHMPPGVAAAADILVVDDMDDNLEILARILQARGYRVRAARDGRTALAAARNSTPDLILLDVCMPGMNGYEVCRELKADDKLRDVPVIFLSALNETTDKVTAFKVGGADYITKPFQLEEVCSRVNTHITLRAAKEYLKEKNRFLEYTFSRFVPPEVVETMKQRPINEFLTMERCEVSILFADLRGFTSMAKQVAPEEIQETLNSFLGVMVEEISGAHGMVDKYLGDGVMALFGAPFRQTDHAWRSVKASLSMQRAHRAWMAGRAEQGKLAMPLGIGVATGTVVAGPYGTRNRMEYTALGHAVNLASRLCSAAGEGEVLTTSATLVPARANAPHGEAFPRFEPKGSLLLKNISEPVEIVSLKDIE